MTLVLDDHTVMSVLDPPSLVDEIEAAIRAEPGAPSDVPERLNLAGGGRFLRVMPAVVPNSNVMGLKTFFGGGGVGVRYLIILASIETGEVLAIMDACHLTAARTAATSAIGSRAMGIKSSVLGVLGSGLEAEVHIRTFAALGGVQQVRLFSPSADNRERVAARLGEELALDIVACASAAEACRGAEHLITATNTGYGGPIACESAWIASGVHLSAIGSTHQDLRELEVDILRRAGALVFDADPGQIAAESGDVRAYVEAGGDIGAVVRLDDVLQGRVALPSEPEDLSIFKSVGTALQDLVAADLAFRRAREAGLGSECRDIAEPKTRR